MRTPGFRCSRWLALAFAASGIWAACSVDERRPSVALSLTPDPFLEQGDAASPAAGMSVLVNGGGEQLTPTMLSSGQDVQLPPPLSLGQACSAQSLPCADGLRCVTGTCRQPCVTSVDCTPLGAQVTCVVGAALDGTGVGACNYQVYCDPAHPQAPLKAAQACAAGSGCRPSESGSSECQQQPERATEGGACVSDLNCAPGYFCGGYGTCRKYCIDDADCAGQVCSAFAPPRRAGDLAVGFCAAPSCDPVSPHAPRDGFSACPLGSGCSAELPGASSTCEQRNPDAGARYAACARRAECQPGLFCGGIDETISCGRYCFTDADCGGPQRCIPFLPARVAGDAPVGSCAETCNPLHPQSGEGGFGVCPDGFNCVASGDGHSACFRPGRLQRYERCSGQPCAAGLGCAQGSHAFCSPYCLTDADCPTARCRQSGLRAGETPVGNCAEVCDPTDAQSSQGPFSACPAGFACSPDLNGASQCVLAGSGRFGFQCNGDPSLCAPGFGCIETGCAQLCFDDSNCDSRRCEGLPNPLIFADTQSVLICRDP